jgi:hypothetical protein
MSPPSSSSSDSRSVRTTSLAALRYALGSTFPALVFSFGSKMDLMALRTPSSPPLLSSSALTGAGAGAATAIPARPRRREAAWALLVIGSLAAPVPALLRDGTRESIKCESTRPRSRGRAMTARQARTGRLLPGLRSSLQLRRRRRAAALAQRGHRRRRRGKHC